MVLILEITVCYWTIVFPFFVAGPEWVKPEPPPDLTKGYAHFTKNAATIEFERKKKITDLIILGFAHSVPCIIVTIDLTLSAIQFYSRHFFVIFTIGIMYLGYHLLQTFIWRGPMLAPIYPSHDWYNYPLRSTLLTVACLVIFCLLYLMLVKVSQIKIGKRFPQGQVVRIPLI